MGVLSNRRVPEVADIYIKKGHLVMREIWKFQIHDYGNGTQGNQEKKYLEHPNLPVEGGSKRVNQRGGTCIWPLNPKAPP